MIPETMTCIKINHGDLNTTMSPLPIAVAGETLIKVAAAWVNRPDILQHHGAYPPPPGASDITVLEISGTVVALGDGVVDIAVGDKVMALVTGGGYAQYCNAPAPQCLPIPSTLEVDEAAAVPETFFTVFSNVLPNSGEKHYSFTVALAVLAPPPSRWLTH